MNISAPTHDQSRAASPFGPTQSDLRIERLEVAAGLPAAAAERRRRQLEELADLLERLTHPGLPEVASIDLAPPPRAGRAPGIELRAGRGVTLAAVLDAVHGDHARGSMGRAGAEHWSLGGALKVVVRVVETLAFAHDRGIVHRGLDPHRVVVGPYGAVQVVGWELARALDRPDLHDLSERGRTGRTADGLELPALAFRAPELVEGRQYDVGPRSDVYALGALLYQLVTGRPPRPAAERDGTALRLRRRASRPLARVIERALSPRRLVRQPDARAFLYELEAALAYVSGAGESVAGLSRWTPEQRVAAVLVAATGAFLLLRGLGDAPTVRGAEPAREAARSHAVHPGSVFVPRPASGGTAPFLDRRTAVAALEGEPDSAERSAVTPPGARTDAATAEPTSINVESPRRIPQPLARIARRLARSVEEARAAAPEAARPEAGSLELADGSARARAPETAPEPEAVVEPPKPSPDETAALRSAAEAARDAGRWEEAVRRYDVLYRRAIRARGESAPATVAVRHELARALGQADQTEASLIHYRGCLALHDAPDARRLDLLEEFALVLLSAGERAEGEAYLEQALALASDLLGPGAARVARLCDQLASSAFRSGDLDRVASAFERALASRLAAGGDASAAERTEVLAQRTSLVQIYQRLGQPKEALRHARALLEATPAEHAARAARSALVASLEDELLDE